MLHYILIIIVNYLALSQCYDPGKVFPECHDDVMLKPRDGAIQELNIFTWLGFVQYMDVILGIPSTVKAPRVVLIHKEFVIGTARDFLHLPKNIKLGNILFGQYHRDEITCGLKKFQTRLGITCDPAYLETQFTDIIPHPEYTRFSKKNTVALVKLIRPIESRYMVPICFPSFTERLKQIKSRSFFMVDYISNIPEDFNVERMAKKTVTLYYNSICRSRITKKSDDLDLTYILCTSGCGVRSGTPLVNHASDGSFELIGISTGTSVCLNADQRQTFNSNPPAYIDIYPYVKWIVATIYAKIMPIYITRFSSHGNGIQEGPIRKTMGGLGLRRAYQEKSEWSKNYFRYGNACFDPIERRISNLRVFYVESFTVNCSDPTRLTIKTKISAGVECTIVCVKMKFPSPLIDPKVTGIGKYNITIEFKTDWFPRYFVFHVVLLGRNTTAANLNRFIGEIPKPPYWNDII